MTGDDAIKAAAPVVPGSPGRWMAVGLSGVSDPRGAAIAAAGQALAGRAAVLLVVTGGAGHDPAELAAGVALVAPGVPMIGGNVGGELCQDGSSTGKVLVVALGGEGFTVATGCGQVAAASPAKADARKRYVTKRGVAGRGVAERDEAVAGSGVAAAAEEAAGCVSRLEDRPHRVLLMLSDAAVGDQQEVLRGAYRAAGAGVPLIGGACPVPVDGSGWQLHDGRVVRGAVVVAAVGSTGPFGVGVGHGWESVGDPMLVTSSSGNVVHELDDQPALAGYLRHLPGSGAGMAWSPDSVGGREFDSVSFVPAAALHPLGLRRRNGAVIRSVLRAEPRSGSLVCAAEVPQGALVWLMRGSVESVLDGMDQACAQALAGVGPVALGLLAFDCVARQRILAAAEEGGDPTADQLEQEAARFAVRARGVPFAGVYTAGEIARVKGMNGFHNKTVAVLAVG